MANIRKLDPTGERASATEAMEATPISGKAHEYRADGDHHPRQDATAVEGGKTGATGRAASKPDTAPKAEVPAERHISEGIPGAGGAPETDSAPNAKSDRDPRT
ncbi:hypothetical protein [Pseudorhodoferax sp. Leaf274]|uniref:hypothetical protein n=1 Tax=Pseudorhodoferax sp. Leaf274 TaxID=1736318 RepID=UPI0012E17C8C|nr:hypothetical protein [Pseudorhodoferax sp. Leaf274]